MRDDADASLQAGGLQESELEPTTVAVDDTPYTSAQSFEDLQLREDLLKVSNPLNCCELGCGCGHVMQRKCCVCHSVN